MTITALDHTRAHPRPGLGELATTRPDLDRAERAATELLLALGMPLGQEGMRRTPARMVAAYPELLTAEPVTMTTFPAETGYADLVVVRDLPVRSVCEHHMLPFVGVAHIAYLPGARILGLSKFARTVEWFARRPQTQERLTDQIAEHLDSHLDPVGIGVVVTAEHFCMTLRGVRAAGARTITSTARGALREDPHWRDRFAAATRG